MLDKCHRGKRRWGNVNSPSSVTERECKRVAYCCVYFPVADESLGPELFRVFVHFWILKYRP